jgi:low temperature requirement protein LtrA
MGNDAPIEPRVSTIELFFDLVFVFTLTQLTNLLSVMLTFEGALQAGLIFTVLFWMYGGFAWATNQVPPDRLGRQLLLLCGMGGFLVCALAIPQAFDRTGVIFGVGYLCVVAVHALLYAQTYGKGVLRFAPVNLVSALMLIVAGLVHGASAYALWSAVIVIHAIPPMLLRSSTRFDVRPGHFVERHGLLLIVAFGESVIAIGAAIDPAALDAGLVVVALLALVLAAELWWIYFACDAAPAERSLTSASGTTRLRGALGAYFYAFIAMLLGVVSIAAGIKTSLGHFARPMHAGAAVALAGGVVLYLCGQAMFRWLLRLGHVRLRLVAALCAAGTAVIGAHVSAAVALVWLVLLLAALILAESDRRTRSWFTHRGF